MESQPRPLTSRKALPVGAELRIYFGLTFAFSWAFHLAISIFKLPFTSDAGSTGQLFYAIGIAGPLVSALALSGISRGWDGIFGLIKTAFRWRFRWTWYFLSFCLVGTIYSLSLGLHRLFDGTLSHPLFHLSFTGVIFAFLGQAYVVIGEEYGWRAYALPRLHNLYGSLGASLILGGIWACWHLPMFFVSGSNQYGSSFLRFSLNTISGTIILSLIYFRTGGSILGCMIFHASSNLWFFVLNVPKSSSSYILGFTVIASVFLLTKLPRPLFKKPFSPADASNEDRHGEIL